MTEFTDAVEKRRGLELYEKWSKNIKSWYYEAETDLRTITYNDGRKEIFQGETDKLIMSVPRQKCRRDLIDWMGKLGLFTKEETNVDWE